MSCQTAASGLAATGAALELVALGRIVWRPWLLPKLRALWALVVRLLRRARRLLPFRRRTRTVPAGIGDLRATGTVSGHGYVSGPMDTPDEPLEERFAILLRRVEKMEHWIAEVEQGVHGARQHASREAAQAYKQMSERVLRIRVEDALLLIVGVAFTLAGAVVGVVC
jgi:hypothetical protein